MASESQKPIDGILADLPDHEEVRRRIAENLQERQLLRQLFKLTEQRQQLESIRHLTGDSTKEGQRRG